MPRVAVEELLEHHLLKRVEDAETLNKQSDEQEVQDWFDSPLTMALINTIEADLLGLSLGFVTNGMDLEAIKVAQAKIEVFGQIRAYLESGETWLEELREERQDATSERTLRSGETEQVSEESGYNGT